MVHISLIKPGRRAALIGGSLLALLLALVIAAGWYYSTLLKDGALLPDYSPHDLDFRVVQIEDRQVTLAAAGGDEDDLRSRRVGSGRRRELQPPGQGPENRWPRGHAGIRARPWLDD